MSGRYAFSLPDPRQRDGWFKLGSIDMTTTAIVVALGLLSMVLYAADPAWVGKGMFQSDLVRDGEVWRTVLWPLANVPDFWALIGLAVFWWIGHLVEDEIGRVPFTWMLLAMAALPAAIVTAVGLANDPTNMRWSAFTYGLSLLSLGVFVVIGIDRSEMRLFFGIPAWVLAAAYVFVNVLQYVGARAWAQLLLLLLVIAVGCFAARQRGMVEVLSFIPRLKVFGGGRYAPSRKAPAARRSGGGRTLGRAKGRGRSREAGQVVEGPWAESSPGLTPLEQAELDVLLDKVSAGGMASLAPYEQSRLRALSERLRGR